MEIAAQKKGKINFIKILLFGIIILLSAVITDLLILKGVFGNFYYSELVPNSKILKNVLLSGEEKIAILYPKYSENITGESSRIKFEIKSWERLLLDAKIKFKIIDDVSIESGKHFDFKIIILPESKFLSDKEVIQLKNYLTEGGSILAVGEAALYSDYGIWRGWNFMSEVFGVKFKKELSRYRSFHEWVPLHTSDDDSQNILVLKGGLSLTTNIQAEYQMNIDNLGEPIAVEVLDQRTVEAGFWLDKQNNYYLINKNKNSGIVYGTYRKGRFVWFGFKINSVKAKDKIQLNRLIGNSIKWLKGEPFAFINDLNNRNIEIKAEKKWKRRVAVSVSNNSSAMFNNLPVEVDLNDTAFNLNLTPEIVGIKEAKFKYEIGSRIVYLLIKDLMPHESRTYFIDYDSPDV